MVKVELILKYGTYGVIGRCSACDWWKRVSYRPATANLSAKESVQKAHAGHKSVHTDGQEDDDG